ncbi:MAG: dehydratase [Methylophaga sp.]|nr:MAG: dehydratase [Methylophaga sp.]
MVESFRKNHIRYQSSYDDLIDKFGSTIRQFPDLVNRKLVDSNVLISLGKYVSFLGNEEAQIALLLEKNDVLKTVYLRLNAHLGEETFVGDWYTVEQASVDQFALVTGDQQWIHTSPDRAKKESPYRTTIAHGFLTLALIPLLTDSVDPEKNIYPEARMVVNYGLNSVVFPFPIKIGKRIRAHARITKLVPMKRGLEVVREIKIEIENSTRPACIAETVVRLYF